MSDLVDTLEAYQRSQAAHAEALAALARLEAERDEAVATNLSQYERMVEWCKRAEAAEERSRLQAEALSAARESLIAHAVQLPLKRRDHGPVLAQIDAALALSEPSVETCECGHSISSHAMEHRGCQSIVHTGRPLGMGSAYSCPCRRFVPAPSVETPEGQQ